MEQGQGRAQECWKGGEQGQGWGRQIVLQDLGWSLQVAVGVEWAELQGQREDWWVGLEEVLLLGQGLVQGLGLGAGPSESSAPASCDHCH